jgi:7-carboxy-7-deazaguanine synthase (Cx14CxxC type)
MKNKTYKIKEIFYSIQGEGFNSGTPAVFIRFSGCNLWTGIENDRSKAICKFCDTDFVGTDGDNGGLYTSESLLAMLNSLTKESSCRFMIFTGGEPLLQLDEELINHLKNFNYFISVESNGTIKAPSGIDWLTISPKSGAKLIQKSGNEIKIVFPQIDMNPKDYEKMDFSHFYIQPKFDEDHEMNIRHSLDFCLKNPKWKLSLQTHKYLGIK